MANIEPEEGFRSSAEKGIGKMLEQIFQANPGSVESKLENFPKYIRRQKLTRILSLYEIFKKALLVKGSIIECGVFHGFGLMTWANLSAILEPTNLTRRIYGFDSFEGFTEISEKDRSAFMTPATGQLRIDSFAELQELIKVYDANRFLGHIPKVQLIKGDVTKTIPEFLEAHKHLVISLLFLDLDLYKPTKIALEHFVPRMPKGAIIAFDELDNPIWPGETLALMETLGIGRLRIERLDFDPYIGYALIE